MSEDTRTIVERNGLCDEPQRDTAGVCPRLHIGHPLIWQMLHGIHRAFAPLPSVAPASGTPGLWHAGCEVTGK